MKTTQHKISCTKDYRLFQRNTNENRPLDVKKHKKLQDSMKLYGFLPCFPIVCVRDKKGHLIVKDGQHRLMIAESLGLPVHYVVEAVDFDVALVNSTAMPWKLIDYAKKHAENGLKAYAEGLEFAELHGLPLGTAFSLLAGTISFANCQSQFIDGSFKVKDRAWADEVAQTYGPIVKIAPALKSARFIEACMAVCRVEGFDRERLITNAPRRRESLVAYSTRDGYLDMMEDVYNFGRQKKIALKVPSIMAMRDRHAAHKAAATKAVKVAKARLSFVGCGPAGLIPRRELGAAVLLIAWASTPRRVRPRGRLIHRKVVT